MKRKTEIPNIVMIFLLMRGFFKKNMATPIEKIEKDYLLKVLYDEKIPLIYIKNRTEYFLHLEKPVKNEMIFTARFPVKNIQIKNLLDLSFEYRGKMIAFTVKVLRIIDQELTCTVPDFLYKNLDRNYSRVGIPKDMQVQFTFLDDRYKLSFPKAAKYEQGDFGEFLENFDPNNLSDLIKQMAVWIKKYASGYKLVLFKNNRPSEMEECLIAETGRTLFLPSTRGGFPETDPFPRKQIITEDLFKIYLEKTGVREARINDTCARFIKSKADDGISSDAWVPILFQEYVIGYIHLWTDFVNEAPLDFTAIDTMCQLTKVLAYSMQIHGYFEKGKLKNDIFEGKVIDISASGLLFAYPHSSLSSTLLPDSCLSVKITTPQRSISTKAVIIRRFKDSSFNYFGCRFEDMTQEDFNFLFQFIYGKPFTAADKKFLSG